METCLLTQEEKIKLCELVTAAGADYIKTSTGFSTGGATVEDVALLKAHVGPGVRVKASGGRAFPGGGPGYDRGRGPTASAPAPLVKQAKG